MSKEKFAVRKVAVLGAGVMGAQIAAHMANAKVKTILFDLPAKEGPRNGIVDKAIANLKKLKPAPLAHKRALDFIQPANFDDDMELLKDCDLVIEAVVERMDIKESLYQKAAPHLGPETIFATNTSGLSIEELCSRFPEDLKERFCGVHFFNPPRYMQLVELIPCKSTEKKHLDNLEEFLVSTLGKGVVRAHDTPNFVANRLGVFSMLATIYNADKFGLRFDVVDDLTGKRLGRPKSATFRTADVVGLDTFDHVADTMVNELKDDPWHKYFNSPEWIKGLISQGLLGQKTKAGIFKKEGKRIMMFDPATKEYVPASKKADPAVTEILKNKDVKAKFKALRESDNPEAQFIWASVRDLFHYIAFHAKDIATTARDIDFAIRWGYAWDQGPLEIWQSIGIKEVAQWIEEDIKAGKTMSDAPLPEWVHKIDAFHNDEGSYNFNTGKYEPRSDLPVYKKQYQPAPLFGESKKELGRTVLKTDFVRAYTLDDEVLIVENLNKMRAVSDKVLEGINQAIDIAEKEFTAMVIYAPEPPFSVGADLKSMMPAFAEGKFDLLEKVVKLFQDTSMRIKYCQVPVVSAVQGFAFGGGCEFVMHSDRVVAALESYIGLVEVGVGLIPAGGGTKEFALRAADADQGDLFAALKDRYMNIAMAKVATSALEAKETGHLRESDVVVFNSYELLHVALSEAKALAEAGYRPGVPRKFPVCGRTGAASIKGQLVNMKEGGFISEYDMHIGSKIAWVMTGGDVDQGTMVDEQWILDLERKVFVELLQEEKTQERIENMMSTGKPLRN